MNSEYQFHIKENFNKANIKNVEDKKKLNECKIYTGWQHEWVSPKRLNRNNPIKIREVVRGPFYSPKLLKISPFVRISSSENNCDATRYKKTYGGIPDPWTECLAIKGYCRNEKYDQILKRSCVSRCMRFWITEKVWKKMGLPFIQGIPDPDKDFSNILKSKCPSKRQKNLNSEILSRSKSLSNSLERNITGKNFTPSNVMPSSNFIDTSEQEDTKNEKSSTKQPEGLDEEVPDTGSHKNRTKKNSVVRKLDDDNYVNSKYELSWYKCDKKDDNLINKTNNTKSNQVYFRSSLNVGTQTSLDRFHRISCQHSSFQTLLKIARKAILPRKTYKILKERWTRKRCPHSLLEHQNRYFSSHIASCHCIQITKKDLPNKITKKLSDKSSTNHVVNNYCPHCTAYILKTKKSDYRCRGLIRDRFRKTTQENISLTPYQYFRDKIQKPLRENVTTQTELMMQRVNGNELRLICSRCNYPYFKAEMGNVINVSTDRSVDHKISSFVSNTYDDVNHHFQGKYNDENKSTVPILRLISKQDDLNFNDFMKYEYIKDMQKNDQKKIRRNIKKTKSTTEKNRKTYDNDRTKEKILNLSVGTQEPTILDNDVYVNISEQSKYENCMKPTTVTSNTYLNSLNETLTTSNKNRTISVNKFKTISTDQNFCKNFPVFTSDCEKNTYLKMDNRKIKNKQEIFSDRKDRDVVSSMIKNEPNKRQKSKNLIDYTRSPERRSRTESKTKSKIKPKREFAVNSKLKSSSKLKIKSKVKSSHNKSNLNVNKKHNDNFQFRARSESNKSNSRSISKFKSGSKLISKSRSKSTSKPRFKSEPDSTSKYIQTGSKVRSFKSLKNPNGIRERTNLQENEHNYLTERSYNCYHDECTKCNDCNSISNASINIELNKFTESSPLRENAQVIHQKELFTECDSCVENHNNFIDDMIYSPMNDINVKKKINDNIDNKGTSTIGFNFDPGPCINRETYNKIIDSNDSIYSSMQNFYRNNENGNRTFFSKKNCWLSKSDNYMNSNDKQEERKNDILYRKGNDCYLKFCNSRYFSSVQSLSDESSKVIYKENSIKK